MNPLAPDYLDRDLPLSKADRKEIRRQAWGMWFHDRRNLAISIVAILAYNLAANGAWMGYRQFVPQPARSQQMVAAMVFVIGLYALILLLQRWRFAPLVRTVTRGQGFNVCLRCGTWLRETGIDRCPGCGWTSS
jgi:hypothetical protein